MSKKPPEHPLRTFRTEKLHWSQEQLAAYLRVDQATVSRIELGQEPSGPVKVLIEQLMERHQERAA